MQFLRNLLLKSSADKKRIGVNVGDFQQELLSPENDYRISNPQLFNLEIANNNLPGVEGFFFIPEYNNYFPLNPFKQINDFNLAISTQEKNLVSLTCQKLICKTLGTSEKNQMTLNDAKKQPEFAELQKALIKIESHRASVDISSLKQNNLDDSHDFLPNIFRFATFHENTYLANSITNNISSQQSVEKIQKTMNQLGFNQSIGYVHTGNHWKSLIIDGDKVLIVNPFNPEYIAPDGSVIMGVEQSDIVSCSLFSLVNNALFLNRVNANDVGLTTRDVQAIKSAISYKGDLCYNVRAKILLQHFADRILVKGLIKKVEKSSLPEKQNILQTLNKQYSSLVSGCKFNSSIKSVVGCFNQDIVNTKLLNQTELLNLFDVNKKLQQLQVVKKEEDVKPKLAIPQNDTDANQSRIQNGSRTNLQVKRKIDSVTIVKEAIKNLESKLQTNSSISADKTAAEFITALNSNLASQKNNQESKTPEAIILDSLSKTDYGNLLSQSNSRFNNKSTFTKDDLIVFTGDDDKFEKFIKDVMPVYEEIERNAKMIKSSLNQMSL